MDNDYTSIINWFNTELISNDVMSMYITDKVTGECRIDILNNIINVKSLKDKEYKFNNFTVLENRVEINSNIKVDGNNGINDGDYEDGKVVVATGKEKLKENDINRNVYKIGIGGYCEIYKNKKSKIENNIRNNEIYETNGKEEESKKCDNVEKKEYLENVEKFDIHRDSDLYKRDRILSKDIDENVEIILIERIDCNIISTSRLVKNKSGKELILPLPMWISSKIKWKKGLLDWEYNASNMYIFNNLKDFINYISYVKLLFNEFDYVKAVRKNNTLRLKNLKDVDSVDVVKKKKLNKKKFVPKVFIS